MSTRGMIAVLVAPRPRTITSRSARLLDGLDWLRCQVAQTFCSLPIEADPIELERVTLARARVADSGSHRTLLGRPMVAPSLSAVV